MQHSKLSRTLFVLTVLLCSLSTAFAQNPTGVNAANQPVVAFVGVKAIDQLVVAINASSLDLLKPFLTPETHVGSLPAQYTERALAQGMPGFVPIDSITIDRQVKEGVNTRYFCLVGTKGRTIASNFLLTPDGKFLELNLFRVKSKAKTQAGEAGAPKPGSVKPTGVKAIDQLVVAIDTNSLDPIKSFLTPETRVGTNSPQETVQIVTGAFPELSPIDSVTIDRQVKEGANTRYFCALESKGRTVASDFLLTPDGKFLELNLVKVEVSYKPYSAGAEKSGSVNSVGVNAANQPVVASVGVKAIDQLVVAVNTSSLDLLKPFMTPETRVGSLPAQYADQVLAQGMPGFVPINSITIDRQVKEGANTRYFCHVGSRGRTIQSDFLLTPDGKFLELNLFKAKTEIRSAGSDVGDITTPDDVISPARFVDGMILVDAEVDGRRGTFVVDSGSPGLILNSSAFAAQAASVPVPGNVIRKVMAIGIGGKPVEMLSHNVGSFNWQGIRFQNKDISMLDLTSLGKGLHVKSLLGLIGYSIFNKYAMTLDYRGSQLKLHKPSASTASFASNTPLMRKGFTMRGHIPIVPITVEGQTYQVGIDCGAQANVLNQKYEPALHAKLKKRSEAFLNGTGPSTKAAVFGELPELDVIDDTKHTLAFHAQKTVFHDDPSGLDGLLGYPFLSQYRTTIDFVNNQIQFDAV